MPGEVISRPQRRSGPLINGVDRNHSIRIGEGQFAWVSQFRSRIKNNVVQ